IDAIDLQARLDPTTGEHQRMIDLPARDPGASVRRGDLRESLRDDGLFPDAWQLQGVDPWEYDFRVLWTHEMAEWRAKRHFLVKTTLHRVAGQDVWPGTRVRFS